MNIPSIVFNESINKKLHCKDNEKSIFILFLYIEATDNILLYHH